MLPEGVHWGDHITPYIVLDILTASESNQVDTLKAELEAVKKERDMLLEEMARRFHQTLFVLRKQR